MKAPIGGKTVYGTGVFPPAVWSRPVLSIRDHASVLAGVNRSLATGIAGGSFRGDLAILFRIRRRSGVAS
jgi:hypothetical protein